MSTSCAPLNASLAENLAMSRYCADADASALGDFCREHPFIDALFYPPPTGKDGFLATNSLLGFVALLARAYAAEFDASNDWDAFSANLAPWLTSGSLALTDLEKRAMPLWERQTTLVLHGPSTLVGAIDLESKFTEAAIGNLQFADYRNFAHGRHHWLAKRGEASGILAFVSDDDQALAERTLSYIPDDIPVLQVRIEGKLSVAMLGSLATALHIAGWAGRARGIDPGRPGVPDFWPQTLQHASSKTGESQDRLQDFRAGRDRHRSQSQSIVERALLPEPS